jgi:hypothetical protein
MFASNVALAAFRAANATLEANSQVPKRRVGGFFLVGRVRSGSGTG